MAETYMVRDLIAELQRLDPTEFTDVEEVRICLSESPRVRIIRDIKESEMDRVNRRLSEEIMGRSRQAVSLTSTCKELEKRIELHKQRLRSLARTVKARRLPLS